ncbi:MAG TPA: response regulator transcription factor [Synergistaceae bacterium]|nr:response regulator transcription factor [Synergistaceae bacterium]
MKHRILLADDHTIVLNGLRELLSKESDMEVAGMAQSGREALELAARLLPSVAVLDVTLGDLNGIEVSRILQREHPDIAVLGLSMHDNPRMIAEFLLTGARGYVLKESNPRELLAAIRALASGECYLSPKVTSVVLEDYRKLLRKPSSTSTLLSPRETEVLQLLVRGASTREIGTLLHISKNTVDTHRRKIMDKLGCNNLAELTRLALREGLATGD